MGKSNNKKGKQRDPTSGGAPPSEPALAFPPPPPHPPPLLAPPGPPEAVPPVPTVQIFSPPSARHIKHPPVTIPTIEEEDTPTSPYGDSPGGEEEWQDSGEQGDFADAGWDGPADDNGEWPVDDGWASNALMTPHGESLLQPPPAPLPPQPSQPLQRNVDGTGAPGAGKGRGGRRHSHSFHHHSHPQNAHPTHTGPGPWNISTGMANPPAAPAWAKWAEESDRLHSAWAAPLQEPGQWQEWDMEEQELLQAPPSRPSGGPVHDLLLGVPARQPPPPSFPVPQVVPHVNPSRHQDQNGYAYDIDYPPSNRHVGKNDMAPAAPHPHLHDINSGGRGQNDLRGKAPPPIVNNRSSRGIKRLSMPMAVPFGSLPPPMNHLGLSSPPRDTRMSKTLKYAYQGVGSHMQSHALLPEAQFRESHGRALDYVQRAFYDTSRKASDRFHWLFDEHKDKRVESVLEWIDDLGYAIASFGLQKYLQNRERGAFFVNVAYDVSRPPTLDWVSWARIQLTMDQTLQSSVACYKPEDLINVFVFYPSPSGKSVAIWRRRLPVPDYMRQSYQAQITQLADALDHKIYAVHVDELPMKERLELPPPPPMKKKKRKWYKLWLST